MSQFDNHYTLPTVENHPYGHQVPPLHLRTRDEQIEWLELDIAQEKGIQRGIRETLNVFKSSTRAWKRLHELYLRYDARITYRQGILHQVKALKEEEESAQ